MPGFGDSAFIVLLALLLFGPKKLPVLARQFGKLMADFRRASNEFRTQMEEELRISEQADRQKEISAIEAAAPVTPALDAPAEVIPEQEHPHTPPSKQTFASTSESEDDLTSASEPPSSEPVTPLPIATSGELSIMPPATGLPVANSSLSPFVDSIPEVSSDPSHTPQHDPALETESLHG